MTVVPFMNNRVTETNIFTQFSTYTRSFTFQHIRLPYYNRLVSSTKCLFHYFSTASHPPHILINTSYFTLARFLLYSAPKTIRDKSDLQLRQTTSYGSRPGPAGDAFPCKRERYGTASNAASNTLSDHGEFSSTLLYNLTVKNSIRKPFPVQVTAILYIPYTGP